MSQKESFDGAVKDNYFDGLVRFDRRDDLIEFWNGVRTENIEWRMVNGYSPIVGRAPRKMYLLRHLSFGLHILSPMNVQPFVQNHSRCAVDANAVSDAAGVPRCDLLDQPRITVGIIEGKERPVARALGIGAGKPCQGGTTRRATSHSRRCHG